MGNSLMNDFRGFYVDRIDEALRQNSTYKKAQEEFNNFIKSLEATVGKETADKIDEAAVEFECKAQDACYEKGFHDAMLLMSQLTKGESLQKNNTQ
jgi:hypothetical protein